MAHGKLVAQGFMVRAAAAGINVGETALLHAARSNAFGRYRRPAMKTAFSNQPFAEAQMPYAIMRGKSGRRHEVDFERSPLRVEIHAGDETVEIFLEADSDELPEERRRFALINIPRHLFSQATAEVAKRRSTKMQ
jgi:hypothetical protein